MTPNSLKANLTKTIHIHEKPRVSLESVNNKSIPEYSNEAELLSRVSQLLEKDLDLLMSDREGDKNRRCDVLNLLCSKIENIKGELNNVNKRNQTLSRQKLVCTSRSVKFLAPTGAQEMLMRVRTSPVQIFLKLFGNPLRSLQQKKNITVGVLNTSSRKISVTNIDLGPTLKGGDKSKSKV